MALPAAPSDRSPLRFLAVTFATTLVLPSIAFALMTFGGSEPKRVDASLPAELPSVRVTDASSIISGPITIARDG